MFKDKSPQINILESFIEKLKKKYNESEDRELIVKCGMCYTPPYIEDIFNDGLIDPMERVFLFTLYPHYSYSTAGVCLKRFFKTALPTPPFKKIKAYAYWYNNEQFNDLIKEKIILATNKINTTINETVLLFTAHALPDYTLAKGDIYSQQLKEHVNLVLDLLKPQVPIKHYLTYQSKATYGKWLTPSTEKIVEELIKIKVKKVVFIPITFISDHIETVYEIDKLYIKKLKEHNIEAIRIENFNDSDAFVEVFYGMLYEK
jgi:ferrochelatase